MIEITSQTIKRPSVENIFHAADFYKGISLFSSNCDDDREYTGFNPIMILTETELRRGAEISPVTDPMAELDRLTKEFSYLPEEISLLGYLSYDFKDRLEEPGLYEKREQGIYPDFYFALFEYYLVSDRNGEAATLHRLIMRSDSDCNSGRSEIGNRRREDLREQKSYLPPPISRLPITIEELKEQLFAEIPIPAGHKTSYAGTSQEKSEHMEAVEKTVHYVKEGDIYQANITRAVYGETKQPLLETAMALYRSNRITYGVFASIPGGQVISTSPELFFRTEAGRITASPIKGTIARGQSLEEDYANKNALLHSEKDIAELAMIVDLLRNDISRVCEPGTVKVPAFPVLMTLDNVYHLYADVTGELLPGTGIGQILKKTFPGGSITGCPKIRACQIIDELEKTPRGIYTGSFGRIGFQGDSVFNIMIRSLFRQGDKVIYNVGGGITLLSDPEDEFEETVAKGRNIWNALQMKS